MVLPSRRYDPLGRRRRGTIYLNYWDLGQLANGTDIDFSKQCTISEINHINFPPTDVVVPNVVFDYNDFKDELLAYYLSVGVENFANTYKQIDGALSAEYESFQFTGFSNYVDGKGFKPSPVELGDDLIILDSLRSFYFLRTDDTTNFKITQTSNYSDTAVAFHLNRSCDVFLVPQIQLWQGGNYYSPIPPHDPSTSLQSQILGMFLAPESRQFTLNNATWDGYKATFFAYLTSVGGNHWMLPHFYSSAYHSVWLDLMKNHPACRLKSFEQIGATFPLHEGDLTSGSPGNFKDGTMQDTSADFSPFGTLGFPDPRTGPWVGLRQWHRPEGLLLAVIRKHPNSWYYVWRKNPVNVPLYVSSIMEGYPTGQSWTLFGGVRWFYN